MHLNRNSVPIAVTIAALALVAHCLTWPVSSARAQDIDLVSRTLENGLQVVVIPDRRAPVVTHMIWYKVGSADEPRGQSGVAHFLEHLLFKATQTYPAGEFSRKVAEIGGQENAFTSSDYTAYYQKVTPEALEMVMRYEADRMRKLVLTEVDMETERAVILEERSQRTDTRPGGMLTEAMRAALYQNHPYGIPNIGWEHEIRALTLRNVLGFYDRFYRPKNAVLIVAGDVDADTVLRYASSTYGKIEADEGPVERVMTTEPPPRAERRVILRDHRVGAASLRRDYLAPSYRVAEPREAEALDLLATILGGASTSRIKRALLVDDPIASRAGASYWGGFRDMTDFSIYATPLPGVEVEDVERRLDAIVSELIENGVMQAELDAARNSLIKSSLFDLDSQTSMARLFGTVLSTGGRIEDVTEWTARLRQVTVDDVNSAARKYLAKRRSVTGYLLTEND
jgi:zinc protease